MIPSLKDAKIVGTYSGLRPSTEYRDYQISIPTTIINSTDDGEAVYENKHYNHQQWITVGGIRSTGLTASSGIGEYVGQLYAELNDVKSRTNISDTQWNHERNMMGVSDSAANALPPPLASSTSTTHTVDSTGKYEGMHIPSLEELRADYKLRSSDAVTAGTVELFGKSARVTHPISSFGMEK